MSELLKVISPDVPPENPKSPEIISPVFSPDKVLVADDPDAESIEECFKYSVCNNDTNSIKYIFSPIWSELSKVMSPDVPPVNPKSPDIIEPVLEPEKVLIASDPRLNQWRMFYIFCF